MKGGWRLRFAVAEAAERVGHGGGQIGRLSAQHFVEHRSQGVDVRGGADHLGPALGLLRGHVVRQTAAGTAPLFLLRVVLQQPPQPEAGDPGHALRRQQDVVGASRREQSPADGRVGGRRQRRDQSGGLLRWPRHTLAAVRQPTAGNVLQREVRPTLVLAEVVNLDDVGMLQMGRYPSFGPEAVQLLRLDLGRRRYRLEGDDTVEVDVTGREHQSQGTAADQFDQLVAGAGAQRT